MICRFRFAELGSTFFEPNEIRIGKQVSTICKVDITTRAFAGLSVRIDMSWCRFWEILSGNWICIRIVRIIWLYIRTKSKRFLFKNKEKSVLFRGPTFHKFNGLDRLIFNNTIILSINGIFVNHFLIEKEWFWNIF